ncbi:MAG TPA: DUF4286 family protein [Burkholderiales bacterium]|nr:DUF4286 family protein [Burkholderiales bacterium]
MTMALLVAGFDASPVDPDEFNDWYDTEHMPERQRIAGFGRCERWIGAENRKIAIATYDLHSLAVLQSEAYRKVGGENLSPWSRRVLGKAKRICRFEAEQLPPGNAKAPEGAGGLLLYAMNVAPEAEQEFNAWYDEEHIPRLAQVPGCLAARRYRITSALSEGRQRYLAIYHLAAPEVCSSTAWKEAAVTPWTERMRPHFRDPLRLPLRKYQRT